CCGAAIMLATRSEENGPIPVGNRIGAREVGLWSTAMVAIAFWANIVQGANAGDLPGFDAIIGRVLDNGAFDVFAWALVVVGCNSMFEPGPASWRQIRATVLAGIIALAPVRLAAAAALVILGGLLLADRRALPAGR